LVAPKKALLAEAAQPEQIRAREHRPPKIVKRVAKAAMSYILRRAASF